MYWLVFQSGGKRSVVIQAAGSLGFARLAAAIAGLADGEFIEAHELVGPITKKIPKKLIGKRLSQAEAAKLLKRIGRTFKNQIAL
jgi:hypothetical protein